MPIKNANVHNLKNVDVDIPLGVLTVITGVAGSGKSSLIRDVFAKQYEDKVILIDQSSITATNRSTVCTFLGFFDEIRKVFAKENNDNKKIMSYLNALMEVGLPYISLGQPLSTFSGGERQRVKLAENIKKKGNNVSIKLYSIYAPHQHPKGIIHSTKVDAEH